MNVGESKNSVPYLHGTDGFYLSTIAQHSVTGRIVSITKYQLGTSGGRTHGVVYSDQVR